ncbi:MAG: DUF2314 domain-containing protein [Bacteroidia bacterium]
MKLFECILILIVAMSSCNNPKTTKTEKDGDVVYGVSDEDKEMNDAIKKANETLNQFNHALKSNDSTYKYFALKTRSTTPNGGEHIWVSNIEIKDNDYFGVIDNLPQSTTEVKIGDTIKIENNNISDWMYIESNKLVGGFTIRVLRTRMNETEKKQFDKECGFVITD